MRAFAYFTLLISLIKSSYAAYDFALNDPTSCGSTNKIEVSSFTATCGNSNTCDIGDDVTVSAEGELRKKGNNVPL